MLKKFLQFLKGNEPEQTSVDGSYLDQLLQKVCPMVETELEQCPEHDPLLVLVVTILRTTMPDRWDSEIPRPLVDTQSPPLEAPQPPPSTPDDEPYTEELDDDAILDEASIEENSSVIEEAEIEGDAIDDEDEDRGEDGDVGRAGDQEQDEAVSDGDESSTDGAIVEDSDASVSDDWAGDDTGELPIDHETDGTMGDAIETEQDLSEVGLREASVVSAPELAAGASSILEESSAAFDIEEEAAHRDLALDAPEVLQTGRVFLGMLIENDRMPVDMQMSVAETMLARDLLLGYFLGSTDFEGKARELLTIVEEKFSEGAFSQARILLQLFQTDRKTQVNNARNLFYEDMILRMGIRRRNQVDRTFNDELRTALESCETLDDKLTTVSQFFDEHLHVKFHLFARNSEQVDLWRGLAARSRRRNTEEQLLRYLPPKRWRPMNSFPNAPASVVHAHISQATIRKFVLRQIKASYFVLRAVGDTGLEPFLDSFFDWSSEKFDVNGVQLMPMIYRRTNSDAQLVGQIFEGIYDSFFSDRAVDFLRELDPDRVEEAVEDTIDSLADIEYDELAPGHYDFGGLVYDRLLQIDYPEAEFSFKLHRLT